MPKIIARIDTWLKTSTAPATELLDDQRRRILAGHELLAESAEMFDDGHARVEMTFSGQTEWIAYAPHWDGLPMRETSRSPVGTIAPAAFRVNSIARRVIRHFEGMRLEAYLDPLDVVTIGIGTIYGKDGKSIPMGMKITEVEAWEFFDRDAEKFVRGIRELVSVKLTGKQVAALTSFAYNVGINAFADSALLERINDRATLAEIQFQFSRWNANNLTGLKRRRQAEAWLWEGRDFSEDWVE